MTLGAFGSSVAALAPSGASPGFVFFQQYDSSFTALDVAVQAFTEGNSALAASGTTTISAITPATAATDIYLFTDSSNRLWAATSDGSTTSTFVVIDRVP